MSRWNTLATKEKIRLARFLYGVLATVRGFARRPSLLIAHRRGVVFELDLAEGIDLAMYLFGGFEPDTYAALKRLVRPGQTVLDIGANSGVHSLPMGRMVGKTGRVIAFEPTGAADERVARHLTLHRHLARRGTAVHAYLSGGLERKGA